MPINVTVAEQDKLKRKLSVEVPLDEVQSVYEEVYQRLRANVRVNGFRPHGSTLAGLISRLGSPCVGRSNQYWLGRPTCMGHDERPSDMRSFRSCQRSTSKRPSSAT